MDYKALVKTIRDAGDMNAMVDRERLLDSNEHEIELRDDDGCLTWGMVLALCDAVEALENDANRWRWYATSPQTALMLGSKLDPNSEQDWVAENGRLADIIMRDAFYQAIEASTPTPAAPSDA